MQLKAISYNSWNIACNSLMLTILWKAIVIPPSSVNMFELRSKGSAPCTQETQTCPMYFLHTFDFATFMRSTTIWLEASSGVNQPGLTLMFSACSSFPMDMIFPSSPSSGNDTWVALEVLNWIIRHCTAMQACNIFCHSDMAWWLLALWLTITFQYEFV